MAPENFIFRTMREKGVEVRYLFGVGDYDPVDEIPKGEDIHFGKYIGWPLCNTPAPCGAEGDMAEFYMKEFWQVFDELGEPSAYIDGRQAGGAFIFGASYGSGKL